MKRKRTGDKKAPAEQAGIGTGEPELAADAESEELERREPTEAEQTDEGDPSRDGPVA